MMLTFIQFLERKQASFRFPSDCNPRGIAHLAQASKCALVGGGSHDHVVGPDGHLVTVVPRHKNINPYTCKGIAKDIQTSCM